MRKLKTIQVKQMPSDLWRMVRASSAIEGVTVREFVIEALARHVKRETLDTDKGNLYA